MLYTTEKNDRCKNLEPDWHCLDTDGIHILKAISKRHSQPMKFTMHHISKSQSPQKTQ